MESALYDNDNIYSDLHIDDQDQNIYQNSNSIVQPSQIVYLTSYF